MSERGPGVRAARDANEVPRLGRRQALAVVDQAERRPARGAAAVAGMGVICGLFTICGPGEHAGAGGGSLGHQGDPDMRIEQVQAVVMAGAMMAGGAAVQAQTAVQWRVADGGNGHWYAVVQTAMPWQSANGSAISSGGHLMTASSLSEYDFVKQLCVATGVSWVWLGGLQSTSTPTYREPDGGWIWIDGSPVIVAPWGVGEPNNDNQQDYLRFSVAGFVDDLQAEAPTPYLIEWSADCNNDGIVDYGQIRAGALPDQNGNNIPDGCECAAHPELAACCVGDLYVDQRVDGADLAALLSHWGQAPAGGTPEDLNRDGSVDGNDLGILLAHWGPCGQ